MRAMPDGVQGSLSMVVSPAHLAATFVDGAD
jgi:hypothetical protein